MKFNKNLLNKIVIGSAQFGMPYGVMNQFGQPSQLEVNQILDRALKNNINFIDTAVGYGSSEESIGNFGAGKFNVITKVPAINSQTYKKGDLSKYIFDSLVRLNISSIYGVLLHEPTNLLAECGETLYSELSELKELGITKKIGISIYEPCLLESILPKYAIDIVQAPINLFDRRLISGGYVEKLKSRGIEIHARSCFLQGLLISNIIDIPDKFTPWLIFFQKFDDWAQGNVSVKKDACLRFLIDNSCIDKVIVGVENKTQFQEIIDLVSAMNFNMPLPDISCSDDLLINPSNWVKI